MSILNNNTGETRGGAPRIAVAGLAALVALALLIYRPWEPRPFSIFDFSEFLPLLHGADGAWGRFTALASYYLGDHGRLNLAGYAGLAIKWTLFGEQVSLWQWTRFAEMALLVIGVYAVLRRLAIGPLGALVGASLFVVGDVAGDGWTRLTIGEPLGTLAILGALWCATKWRDAADPRPATILAALFALVAVLAKEMLAGTLPLLWLVGTARSSDGQLGRPRFDPAARRWLAWTVTLPMLGFFAAFGAALFGGSESFTSIYGDSTGGAGTFVRLFARPWFLQGGRPELAAILLPANTIFFVLLGAGSVLAWRDHDRRAHLLWAAIGAGGLSLALAILYIPWPYFSLYYGMPFLLGPALLLGVAVDALARGTTSRKGLAVLGGLALVATAAPSVANAAAYGLAQQRVNAELALAMGRYSEADRIVLARKGRVPLAWMATAPTLRRYALATGTAQALPPAEDLTCAEVDTLFREQSRGLVLITYHHQCGPFPSPTVRIVQPFRFTWLSWVGGGIVHDSVAADLLAPIPSDGGGAP